MMPTRWVHVGIDLAVSLACRLSVEMCTAMPTCCPLHVLPTSTSSILHMSMMPYIMRQLPLRNYLRHHQIYKRYYTNSRTGSTGSSTIEPIVRPTLINQPNPIQSNPIQSSPSRKHHNHASNTLPPTPPTTKHLPQPLRPLHLHRRPLRPLNPQTHPPHPAPRLPLPRPRAPPRHLPNRRPRKEK